MSRVSMTPGHDHRTVPGSATADLASATGDLAGTPADPAGNANLAVAAAMTLPAAISMPALGTPAGTPFPMLDPAALLQPMPGTEVRPTLVAMSAGHLRRCTFRRVLVVGATRTRRRSEPVYSVDCLFGGADAAVPLGDLAAARSACDSCTYPGRFRADED